MEIAQSSYLKKSGQCCASRTFCCGPVFGHQSIVVIDRARLRFVQYFAYREEAHIGARARLVLSINWYGSAISFSYPSGRKRVFYICSNYIYLASRRLEGAWEGGVITLWFGPMQSVTRFPSIFVFRYVFSNHILKVFVHIFLNYLQH